jgi:hypothetical protein
MPWQRSQRKEWESPDPLTNTTTETGNKLPASAMAGRLARLNLPTERRSDLLPGQRPLAFRQDQRTCEIVTPGGLYADRRHHPGQRNKERRALLL